MDNKMDINSKLSRNRNIVTEIKHLNGKYEKERKKERAEDKI